MKWIKTRNKFLEAKISSYLLDPQKDIVSDKWGSRFLDYEEVELNKLIKQGEWKISESDKYLIYDDFFNCDILTIKKDFANLPDDFCKVLLDAMNLEDFDSFIQLSFENFDPKNPTIIQLSYLYEDIFKLISSETLKDKYVYRDERGVPLKISIRSEESIQLTNGEKIDKSDFDRDFEENPKSGLLYKSKSLDDIIFSDNRSNFVKFVSTYNDYINGSINIDFNEMARLRNMFNDFESNQSDYEFRDPNLFESDIYLVIKHSPEYILNMSVSKFFGSCQNLYDGCYSEQVFSNVFDPNSVPAFLLFKSNLYYDGNLVSKFIPISRLMIRVFEDRDSKKLFFDNTYPSRMEYRTKEIIENYSGNVWSDTNRNSKYIFTPDIDADDYDGIGTPYFDNFSNVKVVKMIGKNFKNLLLSDISEYEDYLMKGDIIIKNLVINTLDFNYSLIRNVKSVKNLILRELEDPYLEDIEFIKNFSDIETIKLSRSKLSDEIFKILPDSDNLIIEKTKSDNFTIGEKSYKNLNLIFSLSSHMLLKDFVNLEKLEKLEISSDLLQSDENKKFIKEISKSGVKVISYGPKI